MMIGNVRGRVQATARKVRVGKAEVGGFKPRILATVKTGSRAQRYEFALTCRRLGLDARRVQTWGWTTVYDVAGAPDALGEFADHPCVNSWEYAVDVKGR